MLLFSCREQNKVNRLTKTGSPQEAIVLWREGVNIVVTLIMVGENGEKIMEGKRGEERRKEEVS